MPPARTRRIFPASQKCRCNNGTASGESLVDSAAQVQEIRGTAMPEGAEKTHYVVLADEVTSGQVSVCLGAFAAYCVRMDLALEELEERFQQFTILRSPAEGRGVKLR